MSKPRVTFRDLKDWGQFVGSGVTEAVIDAPLDCSRFWDAVGAAVAVEHMLDYAEEQQAFYTLQVLHDAFGQMPPGH